MRRALATRTILGALGALLVGVPTAVLLDASVAGAESSTSTTVTATTTEGSSTVASETSSSTQSEATSSTDTASGAPEVRTEAPQRQTLGGGTSRTQTGSTH